MKKVFALILTIALLLTSVAAFAETHPTPNVSSFAQLTVKTSDTAYSLKFTKPVDRLFIIWSDTGLQEMMVDERLNAFVFRSGHKYLAGIEERFVPEKSIEIYDGNKLIYKDTQVDPVTGNEIAKEVKTYKYSQVLHYGDNLDQQIEAFKQWHGQDYEYEVIEPQHSLDEDGKDVYTLGCIKAYTVETKYNPKEAKRKTNVAVPSQAAFITLQDDEWVVYYNRSGQIVGIEYYDGQF